MDVKDLYEGVLALNTPFGTLAAVPATKAAREALACMQDGVGLAAQLEAFTERYDMTSSLLALNLMMCSPISCMLAPKYSHILTCTELVPNYPLIKASD